MCSKCVLGVSKVRSYLPLPSMEGKNTLSYLPLPSMEGINRGHSPSKLEWARVMLGAILALFRLAEKYSAVAYFF